jgi:hypothetical protein
MAPLTSNSSCNPFQPASDACKLGNLVQFVVNASSAADVSAGVKFAREKNIRLVIKNTGHECVTIFTTTIFFILLGLQADILLQQDEDDRENKFFFKQRAAGHKGSYILRCA